MKLSQLPIIMPTGLQQSNQEYEVHVLQYSNVKNTKQIINKIKSNEVTVPQMACLDSSKLVSYFQLQVACTKALLNLQNGCMKTRSVYSEIIHALGVDTSVSQSFKNFGLGNKTTGVIVVLLCAKGGEIGTDTMQALDDLLGSRCMEDNLRIAPDVAFLKTVYSCVGDDLESAALMAMSLQGV
jgi:Kinase binding protein CGI-121